jgi:hypothetical protein
LKREGLIGNVNLALYMLTEELMKGFMMKINPSLWKRGI